MFALRRAAARAVAARGSFSPQRVALRAFAAQCPHDPSKPYHKSPLPLDAAGGLLEYSVVYTDRAMNHMSEQFKQVKLDTKDILEEIYNASATVLIPGSGTYAMEAVARQFATNKKVMVLRYGYFSFYSMD